MLFGGPLSVDIFDSLHLYFLINKLIKMTSLLFCGKRHVINNVMKTRVSSLSTGTSNVMMTSATTMHFSFK